MSVSVIFDRERFVSVAVPPFLDYLDTIRQGGRQELENALAYKCAFLVNLMLANHPTS